MENPTHQSLVNVLVIRLKDLTASTLSMNGVEAKKQRFSVMKRCIFNEEITGEGWFQYKSVKYPDFLIGFSKAGRPVNGQRSAKRSKYRQFTLRELPERRRRKHRRNAILLRFKIIRLLRKKLLL